ncbi:unnamed protein product [Thelazia callipaeda]|uniref:Protein SPEC3 n=1 Tax=Thelazia callipaeda TaxID=103827 RepID=A0A158RB56_THECL|nr:unnamed protein product [Thelazia callipaeda]
MLNRNDHNDLEPDVSIFSIAEDIITHSEGDRLRGWKTVQKALPRIIQYGISEGILQRAYDYQQQQPKLFRSIPSVVQQSQEKAVREHRSSDRVQLPSNDITMMHEAIPFLPVPVAVLCFVLNIIVPGSGTIVSGLSALCMGQPRIHFKEGRKLVTLLVNFLVGVSQFFTITFLFVGWFWSIAWGGLIIIHSMQYREALQQRRQEAVATAAIEALTKDSILHRRDVKMLIQAHKINGREKKGIVHKFAD